MLSLLAKDIVDGRYYYCDEGGGVYLLAAPFRVSEREFVDKLPTFLRKSIDTLLEYDDREFLCIEDLVEYIKRDYSTQIGKMELRPEEPADDLLAFAPMDIVEEYFAMIEDMINKKSFKGINMFFLQLSKNYGLQADRPAARRLAELRESYDDARFPSITGKQKQSAAKATARIRKDRNVLAVLQFSA